ncbi:methyl-accepting chemotaxis protein [Burkholderia sp. Ac-20379]|uniref:methyl-accepting chemotaxis protein n=1 Tax=Burkholderia sp. Ac-20379 TaxID=2703900 RepID=UPI00197D8D32|nr:methyl-accepting chemotaxis protein [Burkholderia sp. Ac-20379]MBN3723901.1 HAMP domain-containing protein [Burkholderia sp. Ac-20379]
MLKNLSIRHCVNAIIGLFGLALIAGALLGVASLNSANHDLKQMYTVDTPAVANLEGSSGQLLRLRLSLATYDSLTNIGDAAGADSAFKRSDQYIKLSNERFAAYLAQAGDDPGARALIDEMQKRRDEFIHQGIEPAMAALKAGDKAGFGEIQGHKLSPLYSAYEKAMLALEKHQVDIGQARYEGAQRQFSMVIVAVAVGLALAIALSLFVRIWLVNAIVKPVDAAVENFGRIASGDLTSQVEVTSHNEMGKLSEALRNMQDSLTSTVGAVRSSTESINVGVGEIAAGNTNLSQRTEEQAASLEETAASIEQLTSTVKQTADNVRQASSLAEGASGLAAEGGQLARDVVGTMQEIVGDSRRIGDIVGVIEGIAFQTNILALNAAVEAARAGEQGRGFAVVASEVRSLAQRSATAAKEIKGLIVESTQRVQTGADLVERSGTTMNEIVTAIGRVSGIMNEIAVASSEQSDGIDQINIAVSQMDEVTQQNAALVEQAAAAAASLVDQAQRLGDAVSVFRIAQHAQAASFARGGAAVQGGMRAGAPQFA